MIGADGATSEVAAAAGLVDPKRVLWGFAVRTYVPQVVDLPAIVLWEPTPWRAFPGYGWVFPGDGGANVGLGIGTRSDRKPVPMRSGRSPISSSTSVRWAPRRSGS